MNQVKNAKLYVTFGNNPAVTRASGGGQSWELYGALREGKTRMVVIDPICTDTLAGRDAEWVAIRPGTDAALCEGMAWVMINENLVDQAFLDKYCVGYDAPEVRSEGLGLQVLHSGSGSRQDGQDAALGLPYHAGAGRDD